MASIMDLEKTIGFEEARLKSREQMGGKGLFQPFSSTNSGSRKIMQESQLEQAMQILKPEVPVIGTGYENRYGDESSSIIRSESDLEIVDKISKFETNPNDSYYLITRDLDTGKFGVITKVPYRYTTETYGYLYDYDNTVLDKLDIGYEVSQGELLRSSYSYDEYQNRCDGVNLLCGYICSDITMEDGIELSESAARKLASPLLKRVQVSLNDNDILLNLLGDKAFPDIGEYINNGILVGVRREKIEESLYMQSVERLKQLLISDEKFTVTGKVIDINIYSNSPDILQSRYSNQQVLYYYNEHIRVCKEIVECINRLKKHYGYIHMERELEELWFNSKRELEGTNFIKDKSFTGTLVEFYILEESIPIAGDKITNRFGGKGIIAKITPDHLMPMTENGDRLEVCFNGFTCTNRLNWGQLAEVSLTFIGSRLLEYIRNNNISMEESIDMIYRYMSYISQSEANEFLEMMTDSNNSRYDIGYYLDKMIEDGHILLSNKPMSESTSIDILRQIYNEFPFIKQYRMMVPIEDSTGNVRYVPGLREMVVGKIYIYRLKQYAEEKFSVTSLSSTNIKNENTRSKASKNHKALYTDTPIRFGEMESGDLLHMGAANVVQCLMTHSVSPQARRLMREAITGDPYHVDINLDSNSKNRNVEILNAYLKTMGLKLEFVKRAKKKTRLFMHRPIQKIKQVEYTPLFRKIPEEEMRVADPMKDFYRSVELREQSEKYLFRRRLFTKIENKE